MKKWKVRMVKKGTNPFGCARTRRVPFMMIPASSSKEVMRLFKEAKKAGAANVRGMEIVDIVEVK